MVASTDRSKKPLLTFDRPGEIARGRDAVPVEPGNFFPPSITCKEAAELWARFRPDAPHGIQQMPLSKSFYAVWHFADTLGPHAADCPALTVGNLEVCREKWWREAGEMEQSILASEDR